MAQVKVASKTKAVVWDFAVDGGAVGTIELGEFITAPCIVKLVSFDVITTPTSATSTATVVVAVGATVIQPATIVTAFPAAPAAQSIDNIAVTLAVASQLEVVVNTPGELNIVIAVEPLTAGKIIIIVDYTEAYPNSVN